MGYVSNDLSFVLMSHDRDLKCICLQEVDFMDNNKLITDGLRTLLLAGVGAAALTVDKSQEILKDLVDRGELTVEQGKALNQELKHRMRETAAEKKADAPKKNVSDIISGLSAEELAELKEALLKAETKE